MTDIKAYEQAVAKQIKILQHLADHEVDKREAIARADLEAFYLIQDKCNDLFAQLKKFEHDIQKMKADLSPESLHPDQRARLERLQQKRAEAAKQATANNEEMQKLLSDLIREMKVQLAHIRKGKKALSGYHQGVRSKKDPKIFSGEI